jgi:NADH-quinone oxidoreductase subunit L
MSAHLLAEAGLALPVGLYATMPLWPLVGALLVGVLIVLRQPAERAYLPVVAGAALSALLGVALFFDLGARHAPGHESPATQAAEHAQPPARAPDAHGHAHDDPHAPGGEGFHDPGITHTLYHWMSLGADFSSAGRWISVNLYFDRLTGVMMLFVTVVSLCVVIYAIGYMRDHHGHPQRGYERFFAYLGLFIFSMAMLALAGNFVLLYLGWELVGLCSYLLIGFHYQRPEAAAAAKKAFLVNRIGDLGFALGIFALYLFVSPLCAPGENPLDYAVAFRHAGALAEWQITTISLLLLCGALGKSAQFPLHVWLPDAMEGPTPVSALIHAATMVTAGIYMIARCGPLFMASETTLTVIVWLGTIGAILAATIALAQYDMKRILAYSTISQLAFMFVALGVGASDSAVFHVFTHAFFKALLFLCAGSVMHAMGDVIDLRRFSGLRAVLPTTQKLMLVGCLALAGVPLLAGFWSKDEIVHAAWEWHPTLGVLLTLTAGLTAYYTFRMYFMCFHGPLRLPREAGDHPHDSPPVMLRPLYFLAFGAIFAGYLGVTPKLSPEAFLGFLAPHGYFHHYLHDSTIISSPPHAGGTWIMYLSSAVALAGIGLAWARYGTAPTRDPDQAALGGLWKLWNAKYRLDEIYNAVFVRPLRQLGDLCFGVDRNGIDGAVWLVSAVPRGLAFALRFMQQGALQGYALSMVFGLLLLLALWRWAATTG